MENIKKIIWSNDDYFESTAIADIIEANECNETTAYEIASDLAQDDYDQLIDYAKGFTGDIVTFAWLGLWNGEQRASNIQKDTTFDKIFQSSYEPMWYIDDKHDLRCTEVHHDGTNHFMYRSLKKNLSYEQEQNFFKKLCSASDVTRKDIIRYTDSIGKLFEDFEY